MCGIFGYCSDKLSPPGIEALDSCRDTLRLRGPDMAGSFQDRGLYLGFRRLAILDLSADANQPMTSSDGRYSIVFNGEIYNFLELRKDLERQGEVFRTSSDTEVLLKLYASSGLQGLTKLNGMFAFGLYDKLERTLLFVRDRLGVKPLFYWKNGRTLAFASEVCALRGLPGFPSEIDPEALGAYLRTGVMPEWISVYPGLSKLPPGCWMRYHLDTGSMDGPVAYWELPPVEEQDGRTEADWLDEVEALLWDATRIRLRSDVPLGVFLSGGIDSGLVAAAAAKQLNGLTSLTISFAGQKEDETPLALETARHSGLSPITRNVDVREGMELLPQIMARFDEPFSDTSALPTSLVCAAARKSFTVVLSGDGGDEVFGGYQQHVRAWRWRWLDRVPLSWRHTTGSLLAGLSMRDSLPRRFFRRLGNPVGRFGLGGALYLYDDWLDGCFKPELIVHPNRLIRIYNEHLPAWAGASSIDLSQRTDLRQYLLEDILIKVDRMSMMHSLEVRSPFLDYRLVELGLKVPSRLRVKKGRNKYLLRQLAARHLPKKVSRAPKKGFDIPADSWLRNYSSRRALATLLEQNYNGFPDPFVKDGADRLSRLARANHQLAPWMLLRVLCYRWWCQARATD